MALISVNVVGIGEVGVTPRIILVYSTDNLATITAAGYLNAGNLAGTQLSTTDMIAITFNGGQGWFQVSINTSTGVYTLVSTSSIVNLPTIANHIATYTNTDGSLGEDAATAINGGNIQAGLSGTAGYLATFPGTAAKGSLRLVAAANAGNTVTQITNASFGQASVLTIPDVGGAAGNFNLSPAALVNGNLIQASGTAGLTADAGVAAAALQLKANIKANTVSWSGGGTSHGFTVTGLTSSSIIIPAIQAQTTGTVYIESYTVGTNTITVTFSADPGAMVLQYVAFIAAQ
jgi:hypothetical protein